MREETRKLRRAQIEDAAYEVLEAKGYEGASMLAIAKAAKASNETLYKWYGDKAGLFGAMVAANAEHVANALTEAVEAGQGPIETLRKIAPVLLGMLVSESAIALNKAAIADKTGALGKLLSKNGREVVGPMIAQQMAQALEQELIDVPNPRVAAQWYIGLVVGDLQIRRATGALGPLRPDEVRTTAGAGVAAFIRLCGTSKARTDPDPRLSML